MKKNDKKKQQSAPPPLEKKWQRWLPWAITGLMALWIVSGLRTTKNTTEYKIEEFSQMPVLLEGRVQPWDSVAKNTLLILRGKSTVLLTERPQEELSFLEKAKLKKMTAIEWLLEVMTRPEAADTRYIFRIDNQEVLNQLKLPVERKFFTFNEIRPNFGEIQKEATRIRTQRIEELAQSSFEKGAMKVYSAVNLYYRLKNSLRFE